MDQKRLYLAVAISIVILLVSQLVIPRPRPSPVPQPTTEQQVQAGAVQTAPPLPSGTIGAAPTDAGVAAVPPPKEAPRLPIDGVRVQGSLNLLGAKLDDLVLHDYRQTLAADSPLVRLLEPRGQPEPYFVQFGWTGADLALPGEDTVWTASAAKLDATKPVTLSWDNGQGQTFRIILAIDDNYMLTVTQAVANAGDKAVTVRPWTRIRREYTPVTSGFYVLHEGMVGVAGGTLKEITYSSAKSDAEKSPDGGVFSAQTVGGWSGITDKYWLAALVPDQAARTTVAWNHTKGGHPAYQVAQTAEAPTVVAPGAEGASTGRVFAGAKEVRLLERYEATGIPDFTYAVDWGWFWFMTKPFFLALDWLNQVFGNFGLAIMAMTVALKAVFFPLANRSYRSMNKMKLLGPKMTAMREQYKEEPAKLQSAMMQLYKAEKVNPVSGCLPLLLQIPVFFSLYKVIVITIEMRQAPFFGWIHDLSAVDPTNLFNLFGLIPFDPAAFSHFLHLGIWPLILGTTMYFQQKMNPAPPDPMQAKLFAFMPWVFMFMMASFPAGLVIYWSWNNLLTIGQQWLIKRRMSLSPPQLASS